MVSRDYTKEIGLESATPKVPWPIAIVVLLALGAAVWFGVVKLQALSAAKHTGETVPAAKAGAHSHK